MNLSRIQRILLSLTSGALLWAGWPSRGFPFLLLIAFCPLLLVEDFLHKDARKRKATVFFGHAYLAMLVWNALTTWWVCNSTIVGGSLAIICNSLFMALVLMFFHIAKRNLGNNAGYTSLVLFWLAFEYLHLNWQLSWPWLTLGFGFSNYTSCIQWYQFTGPPGGTLWILCINILVYKFIRNKKQLIAPIVVCVVPLLISYGIYYFKQQPVNQHPVEMVAVQPNIDPYNEKFSGDYETQLKKMLELADQKVDENTQYLIFPETALTEDLWENNLEDNKSIPLLRKYLLLHPGLTIITGAATTRAYHKGETIPESARKFTEEDGYYDDYNTALQIDSTKKIQVYHKSKLVPGVEFMPFNKLLAPLGKLAFDLGGTSGTLGTQKEPTVFYSSSKKVIVAPAICYESIYGEYIGEYVKKGAQIIVVITNDGWWEDTPGYKQHLSYARLLSVETGKSVVQCANTGFSAFIDPSGNVTQQTKWWQPAVIKGYVNLSDEVTFYVLHGDYLGLYACFLSLLAVIFTCIPFFRRQQ